MKKYVLWVKEHRNLVRFDDNRPDCLLGMAGLYNTVEKAQEGAQRLYGLYGDSYQYEINEIEWED